MTYGQTYRLSLANVYDRFASELSLNIPSRPFTSQFFTPDPKIAYVAADGSHQGRVVI
ncbi:MAG: hypothetical protein HC919_14705, partial [Oscillatoriales cyanobacterium SM2_2_1]|nr:hypothetical protein [Oscillatoriales cyanobacterium SM2_2_1]